MVQLVEQIFESFTTVITGLANGMSEAFGYLIYKVGMDGQLTNEFNPLVLFIFMVAGISLAVGILWKIFGLIRGASHNAG